MRGFTLVEVVVALVLLQVALLCVFGTTFLALRALSDAEARVLRARAAASIVDSLRAGATAGTGTRDEGHLHARWLVDADGVVDLVVTTPDSAAYRIRSVVRLR